MTQPVSKREWPPNMEASQVIFEIYTHKYPLILSSAYSADLAELKGKRIFLQLSYSNMAENLGSQKVKALYNF